ncbi:hypothetical protein BV25DRAFT_1828511 [Artomyces pyxidatus]|uniref:Uncharacterized protein n=1 Tax=Artomyces pyxidatus TaxID=48021 RepID=A0ACB8STV2_9AGAM|nr:hypothetical protein BV25DRAFT_1828511 [Artomyces pyxidatus]
MDGNVSRMRIMTDMYLATLMILTLLSSERHHLGPKTLVCVIQAEGYWSGQKYRR